MRSAPDHPDLAFCLHVCLANLNFFISLYTCLYTQRSANNKPVPLSLAFLRIVKLRKLFVSIVSIVSECRDNPESEPSLDCNVTESVEIIATPTTTGKRGEDKEKKKIRDRFVAIYLCIVASKEPLSNYVVPY